VEIHSPKLLGGASEGGANVFKLKYFGQDACLAQSPQFYKQMTAACGDFERVFEIGPVFRAEDSNTHRHLCEFVGLDMEMVINEHYYEVLDMFGKLFTYIFEQVNERFAHELAAINAQHPFEPLKFLKPTLRITFAEGIQILRDAGVTEAEQASGEDLSTPIEKVRLLARRRVCYAVALPPFLLAPHHLSWRSQCSHWPHNMSQ
jgi:aspartyl/asparaginyl-tRNA synthetase